MLMVMGWLYHLLAGLHRRCIKPTPVSTAIMSPEEEPENECANCRRTPRGDLLPTDEDIKTVMERLGLEISGEEDEGYDGEECGRCRLVREATHFLEEKVATEEELREAFSIFDRNGDGFIAADELRSVLLALGFSEGRKMKDCASMIRMYDEDGDGRICLSEFKSMLHCAA